MKFSMSMKHPFWLVNSILLIFLVIALLFTGTTQQKKPRRIIFDPEEVKPLKKDVSKIDPSKIYTNDLFNTYREPSVPRVPMGEIKPIPQPPMPAATRPSAPVPPRFLEPLNITLKGIILTGDEKDNRAIIQDNKTKEAKNYKIGDKFEDAQVIRILKNKTMLIRSNGQQETLYVNQFDAKAERLLKTDNWAELVKKVNEENYIIDAQEFSTRVRSLAQLIDLLNITTVYQKGKSVGVRIGKQYPESLGNALGLLQGDIITSISDIPATDTSKRFEIYKKVIGLAIGSRIKVTIVRQTRLVTISYILERIENNEEYQEDEQYNASPVKLIDPEKEKETILQDKIAYTMPDSKMRKIEKHAMLEKGKKSMSAQKNALMHAVLPKESV